MVKDRDRQIMESDTDKNYVGHLIVLNQIWNRMTAKKVKIQ